MKFRIVQIVCVCVDIASDKIRQFLRISESFQVKTVVK